MLDRNISEVHALFGPDHARRLSSFLFSGVMQADLEKHLGVEKLSVDVVTCLSHLQVAPLPNSI